MIKPKIGKAYIFVRTIDGRIEHTQFVRYEDGSADFVADGAVHVHECDPNAWQGALASLEALGFFEVREAKQKCIVAEGWLPSPATDVRLSTVEAQQQVQGPTSPPSAGTRP